MGLHVLHLQDIVDEPGIVAVQEAAHSSHQTDDYGQLQQQFLAELA